MTRSYLTCALGLALGLACSTPLFAQTPEFFGKWEDGGGIMSLELEVGAGAPFPTITSALAAAAGAIGVVPVTINVAPLPGNAQYDVFLGESFPIQLPAHGVTIDGVDIATVRPIVNGGLGGVVPPAAFLFNSVGNQQLPASVIRGLEIRHGFVPVARSSANIRIEVPRDPSIDARQPVAPEIRDCLITGDLDCGIDIVALESTLVTPVIERNVIRSTDPFFGIVGVRIDGWPFVAGEEPDPEVVPLTSPFIRANAIERFVTNLEVVGGGISCRPRVWSNFIQVANTNVFLEECAPLVINNTIAFAFSTGATAIGITWQGLADLTLTNNCIWNPDQQGVVASDVVFTPPYPGSLLPWFNFDEDQTLEGLFPGINFSQVSIPTAPGFANNAGAGTSTVDLHLQPGSGLIDAGIQGPFAGNDVSSLPQAFAVGVAPYDVFLRTDQAYDADFGTRTIMAVDIGGDEFLARNGMVDRVIGSTLGVDLDLIGNLRPNPLTGMWDTDVVVNGSNPGDSFLLLAGTGSLDMVAVPSMPGVVVDNRGVFEHTFVFSPVGDVGMDLVTPNCAIVLAVGTVGTPLTINFGAFNPANCEAEIFLQAAVLDASGNGELTNRMQIDLNCP